MKAFVGGLNIGKRSVARTARRLSTKTGEQIVPFTYSWTMRHPDKFKAELSQCDGAIAHSLGVMAVAQSGIIPGKVEAIGAPLPVSRARLFGRAVLKTVDMILRPASGNRSWKETYLYLGGALAEMLVHPISNMRSVINGSVSKFNAFDFAATSPSVELLYGERDEFFARLNEHPEVQLATYVPGAKHDDLILGTAYDDYLAVA